ncbi:sulfotransferase family 2 domain-containing protein [Roseovarius aestuarii]|uniref:Sulfotransferase family protein n=1 Tax=Roseovarius aestuarii TaxID=475083 RepID=A0A1X7BVB4_9RHOB|nr:sulfotransferase family 2 domain-containing protein [Roseovarius aestuarii]SMC13587.1 Sulfotransferase family protein [Roseovarius aestuarii]
MIISPGRNYIFVHIPKTGGTSLALALEARAMKDDILIGDTPKALRRRNRLKGKQTAGRLWKHSTLTDIDGLVPLDQITRAFTFTLVRNPWDRMVSYYHWLQDQSFDHPAVELAKSRDFNGFLNAPQTKAALIAQPSDHYMTSSDGREHASAYLRLEHFAADAAPLWDHLGFELSLPATNQSKRDPAYENYYSDADRQLIADICASDIRRFGYRFG